ncbi:MAG: glutamyl-tRNA amidotransferase [Gammaproteobacteria bacterium]|nr:glutamyl-tRNA amidotransferase [Gammaproteobacteria bacterium]OUV67583.1 MAG: glutamyl-tRNA amidotransferase [Gammaproteobacteria bacterium TMED133]
MKIADDIKTAMRSRDKRRLAVLRLVSSEFKRVEIDERVELDDVRVIDLLNKMTKQRRDSLSQYIKAGREDLADQEQFEIELIAEFTPQQLDQAQLLKLVEESILDIGAASMADMGKVMKELKNRGQGRVDMSVAGELVRSKLS